LHLNSSGIRLNRARLEELPFVSAKVWKQVRIEDAFTPVDFILRFGLDRSGVHYKLELAPREVRLHVASIDLDADHASGKVIIEDKLVRLLEVKGHSADGTIATNAELDFRKPVSELEFALEVNNAELHLLPHSWRLPAAVNGELSGRAKLHVSVTATATQTSGEGQGTISGVQVLGLPFPRTVPLRMYTENHQIHFGLALPARRSVVPASVSGRQG
jgi:hypothetical protein